MEQENSFQTINVKLDTHKKFRTLKQYKETDDELLLRIIKHAVKGIPL